MTPVPRWRKSSFSGEEGNCVEVAQKLDALRDSKNPAGPTLAADVRGLLASAKADRFRR